MAVLIPFIIILPLVIFYVWMFWHMTKNLNLPTNSGSAVQWPPMTKFDWMIWFILLNIFTAGYYFFTEYRQKR